MIAAIRKLGLLTAVLAVPAAGQQPADGDIPRLLPEAEEIRLALSAAPPAISGNADVWVLRRGGHVKVRSGTSGVACIVTRDHPESLYPICFDAEATRTMLPLMLREQQLREKGLTDEQVAQEIEAAIARRELTLPSRPAMAWMMSPSQVIYAGATGPRVGAWHPHVMIYSPYATTETLGYSGLPDGDFSLREAGRPTAHILIITRDWATKGS